MQISFTLFGNKHPYSDTVDADGFYNSYTDSGYNLTPANYYGFDVYDNGNLLWTGQWQDSGGTWHAILSSYMGSDTMGWSYSGGEASCYQCPFGYIATRSNQFYHGQWSYYYPSRVQNNVNATYSGPMSPADWTMNY